MNWGFRGERTKKIENREERNKKKKERERGGGDFRRRYRETERGTYKRVLKREKDFEKIKKQGNRRGNIWKD
jgi:hypothetical protein